MHLSLVFLCLTAPQFIVHCFVMLRNKHLCPIRCTVDNGITDTNFCELAAENKGKKRDPEAHSAKKGNTWNFGYKTHVGVDHETGIVHSLEVTSANKHDVCMMAELLTGEEQVVYGDSGYLGAEKRGEAVTRNKFGKRIHYKINRRPSQRKHNSNRSRAQIKRREREKSSIRAKVEHVFAVVKQQLRFQKTRC